MKSFPKESRHIDTLLKVKIPVWKIHTRKRTSFKSINESQTIIRLLPDFPQVSPEELEDLKKVEGDRALARRPLLRAHSVG
jgi:hypothetical protein